MSEEEIKKEFGILKPDLEAWGKFVDQTIKNIISNYRYGEIQIFPKYRLKNEQSFINKALYRGKGYDDPLVQIEDKVGTRVVVLVTDIVDRVSNDLKTYDQWNIKESKTKHEIFEEVPDKFGYQSIHYIVTPKDNCCNFASGSFRLKQLTCEIQVRTLLQHAYAEISHDNVYKGPYKNDPVILRQLAKSMALMEAADDYFCKTLEQVSAPQNKENMLLEHLVKVFMEIRGLDEPPAFDRNLAEEILSLVADEHISKDDIDVFLKSNPDIVDAIRYGKSVIIQQPIIILLAYCLDKIPYSLEKWDIDLDVYDDVCRSLGYAPNR